MPLYAYKCYSCEAEWEDQLSMSDRNKPVDEPCPHCQENDVKRQFSVNLHHGVINPLKKMPEDFKENMKRIKKEHPVMQTSYF